MWTSFMKKTFSTDELTKLSLQILILYFQNTGTGQISQADLDSWPLIPIISNVAPQKGLWEFKIIGEISINVIIYLYQIRPVYKVIIEKSRDGRFLLNRNWDLGWIWAGWHYWKKKTFGPIMSNFWGRVFQVFVGKKPIKNIEASALKSCIKWS